MPHSGSPHIQARDGLPLLSAIQEPEESRPSPSPTTLIIPPPRERRISQLRVDAFLGEWLSPDYFDNIIPPPSSVMMVAGAKAELLRPGETIQGAEMSESPLYGHFPGGWRRDRSPASSADEEEKTGLANMAALGHSLPNRTRAVTYGSSHRLGPRDGILNLSKLAIHDEPLTYTPPIPTYAISTSDPIPPGYVAHARDACVDIKYQWDSMRPPQDWGNGGEYGEEWSSMHKRLRSGLQRMIAWYEEHGTSISVKDEQLAIEDDPDTDTVLILVTHGAGCNALIGALTNQPVLLDVGMASLTMAERKANVGDVKPTVTPSSRKGRRGSIDLGIADEYEMKLTASTEHLRAASTPMHSPQLGFSPSVSAGSASARRNLTSSSSDAFTLGEPMSSRSIAAAGLHRSASGTHGLRPYLVSSSSKMSSGLWRRGTANSVDSISESSESDSFLPNFGNSVGWQARATEKSPNGVKQASTANGDTQVWTPLQPARKNSQRGLWGDASFVREDDAPKRRWTSVENP